MVKRRHKANTLCVVWLICCSWLILLFACKVISVNSDTKESMNSNQYLTEMLDMLKMQNQEQAKQSSKMILEEELEKENCLKIWNAVSYYSTASYEEALEAGASGIYVQRQIREKLINLADELSLNANDNEKLIDIVEKSKEEFLDSEIAKTGYGSDFIKYLEYLLKVFRAR